MIIILEPLLRELCEMVEGQQESEAVEELNKEINDLNEQRLILSQVMRKGYMDSALFYEKNNDIGLRLLDCKRRKALLHSKRPGIKEIASTERLIRLLQDEGGAAGRVPGSFVQSDGKGNPYHKGARDCFLHTEWTDLYRKGRRKSGCSGILQSDMRFQTGRS